MVRNEQFLAIFRDHDRVRRLFGEGSYKIFKVWPNGVFCMVGKLCFESGCEFGLSCPRYVGIKRVDALVERFVVNRDIDIFGKTPNGRIDF